MPRYEPTVSNFTHDLRRKLTDGYDAFSLADMRRQVLRLVENGVSCAQWKAALEHHPRALQPVLAALLDRPPFASFDAYLTRRSLGRETSFASILADGEWADLLGLNVWSRERPGHERHEQIRRAVTHVQARLRQEDRNPLFGSPDRPVLVAEGEDRVIERVGAIPAVPIAAFALPSPSLTLRLALQCEVPSRYGLRDWDKRTVDDLLSGAKFWSKEDFGPAIRIGMFGLVEVDDLSPDKVAATLPHGAQPAGLVELLYAIELYPRLLSWVLFDLEGGFRPRRADFWLCGMRMEPFRDRIPACYVDADPLLETPTLRWGTARDPHFTRDEIALVPYVIPLEPIDPKRLDLERPRF